MGIVVLSVVLLGTWAIKENRQAMNTVVSELMIGHGITVGEIVAAKSRDYLLTKNYFALQELIEHTFANNSDFRYIFVLDNKEQVVLHTFIEGMPEGLRKANTVSSTERYSQKKIQSNEGFIWDIAIPISSGNNGVIRIGISESKLKQIIKDTTLRIILNTLVISIFGLLASYFFISLLNTTIHSLLHATKSLTDGDLQARVNTFWPSDELGKLIIAFNKMAERLQKSVQEMEKGEVLRKQLLSTIITAQEDERKRISRELHDEAGQSLTALSYSLSLFETKVTDRELLKKINEMKLILSKTLQEVHNLALQLRPIALDSLPLDQALEKYIRDFMGQFSIKVECQVYKNRSLNLPYTVSTAVYRIVQEALTNVVKHSNSNLVKVLIEYESEFLLVMVEDNGEGFNLEETLKSPISDRKLGLFGMEERAKLLGGNLIIDSLVGEGTTIYLKVPIKGGG
jgi:signal transduction histidine kinase